MFVIAQRIGKGLWELEEEMPPDELFEWETFLRLENEERESEQKRSNSRNSSSGGGRKRVRKF